MLLRLTAQTFQLQHQRSLQAFITVNDHVLTIVYLMFYEHLNQRCYYFYLN